MIKHVVFLAGLFLIGKVDLCVVSAAPETSYLVTFFVDPIHGIDATNDGLSPEFAFRTIQRAADALAMTNRSDASQVPRRRTVRLFPGNYWLDQSLNLNQRHSNTTWTTHTPEQRKINANRPRRGVGKANRRRAHIRGGYKIKPSSFKAWHKNPNILVARIPSHVGDLGRIRSGDLQQCANSKAEVFYNGEQLTLARYPNIVDDKWTWDTIVNVTSNVSFTFHGDRPLRRQYEKAPDLWLHGYWKFDWADNYVAAKVNADEKSYTIDTVSSRILYELTNGARYYVLNLLQELDAPGEYYIDRKRRLLYVYPPVPMSAESEIVVSAIENLVRADHLTDTSFVDIVWSTSRGTGLNFSSPSRVEIIGGSISNVGGAEAILLKNATDCRVRNVTISDCNCGGINVTGGDRRTLASSKTELSHNHIANFAKWKRTYMAGILFGGCGHVISNNTVAHAPHTGITGRCNDCVFSGNYLHDLCYEGVDAGAFYAGRSWAERGNIVKNNVFQRIRRIENATHGYGRVQAIYLDDQMSGYDVINNTVLDSDTAILLGGGRHNKLIGNKSIRTQLPLSFDARGLTWDAASCKPGNEFEAELASYDYMKPPWSSRYPELAGIFEDRPCTPTHNVVSDMVFCGLEQGSSWIETPGADMARLLVWDNRFANISEDESMCKVSLRLALTVVAR